MKMRYTEEQIIGFLRVADAHKVGPPQPQIIIPRPVAALPMRQGHGALVQRLVAIR